ncbi:S24 family peptidase [Paludibacterium sp. dN 18-1]|uniref:S24 family peptidase n=1 Tax=Paludibacterium denitrificans TaxID=2675226 RepID=A0A844GC16_9NEIS|nr:S24 family peptidase [Paludibacterium denitrificans]
MRVEGESMMPEYHDGDLIFVDQRGAYDHGDDIIVRSPDGKATFKRLQKTNEGTYLLALNPSWPDRIIRIPEESQICGKVIFSGRQR